MLMVTLGNSVRLAVSPRFVTCKMKGQKVGWIIKALMLRLCSERKKGRILERSLGSAAQGVTLSRATLLPFLD